MIRLNRNNEQELILTQKDLEHLLAIDTDFEHKKLIEKNLQDIYCYEQENHLEVEDIRVERSCALGELIFEQARKEVANDPENLIDSLIYNACLHQDDNFLDNIYGMLEKEKTRPSDDMVKQILLQRKNCFTDEKRAPFSIQKTPKVLTKENCF